MLFKSDRLLGQLTGKVNKSVSTNLDENQKPDSNHTRYSRNSEQDNRPLQSHGHPAGWLLGFLQRNHIIDLYGQELPELAVYKTLTRARESFVQNMAQETDALYKTYHEKLDQKKPSN